MCWALLADRRRRGPCSSQGVTDRVTRPVTSLLVEDNPSVRTVVTRHLARAGIVVITESNSTAALELGRRYGREIDLLITDAELPGDDGITLALEFKTVCPDLRVLFLNPEGPTTRGTGTWNPRLEVLGRMGMECLLKPFTEHQLVDAVRQVLSRDPAAPTTTRPQ